MAFNYPYGVITPIPDTEPDAIPSLWNTRYEEIDANFKRISDYTGAAVCETSGDDASKRVDVEFFVLNEFSSVKVIFAETNSAKTPTLNVSSTGEMPILSDGKAVSALVAGRVYEFFYYGGAWIASGSGVGAGTDESGSLVIEGSFTASSATFNGSVTAASLSATNGTFSEGITAQTASFAGNVSAETPVDGNHLTTKDYVDEGDEFGKGVYDAFCAFHRQEGLGFMAYRIDLICDQGTRYDPATEFYDSGNRPIDFTGYTAHLQVRRTAASDVVIDELSSEGDDPRIEFDANKVTLHWPQEVTTAIKAGRYVYDLEVTSEGGNTYRLQEGAFVIRAEVTR